MRKVLFLFAALFLCLLGHAENFLVLGDSHGAMDIGWVNQLKEMRPNDRFCNLVFSRHGFQP